jgi:dTMP kinase
LISPQGKVLLWNFPDRSSATGKVINQYLAKQMELSDAEVHELFSSNRREKM